MYYFYTKNLKVSKWMRTRVHSRPGSLTARKVSILHQTVKKSGKDTLSKLNMIKIHLVWATKHKLFEALAVDLRYYVGRHIICLVVQV